MTERGNVEAVMVSDSGWTGSFQMPHELLGIIANINAQFNSVIAVKMY